MSDSSNSIVGGVFTGPVVQARDIGGLRIGRPASPPPATAGLPPEGEFSGREAWLGELAGRLDPRRPGPAATVVTGLPGVGKTALATRAAHRAWTAGHFHGVLFIDLQGYDPERRIEPARALASLLQSLGVHGEDVPPEDTARVALYRSILAEHAGGGRLFLVVLDNAFSAGHVLPLLPGSGDHRVLITSRHTLAELDGARIMELEVMPPGEAVALVSGGLRSADPGDGRAGAAPGELAELARLCGHLPLALRIAVALLVTEPGMPVAELAGALAETAERLATLEYGEDLAIRAAFDLSYRHLDPAQAGVFRSAALHPGPELGTEAAAALAGLPERRARRLLGRLRAAHLIEGGAASGRYRFHDLLRDYARERAAGEDSEPDRAAALDRLLGCYRRGAGAAAAWLDRPAGDRAGPDRAGPDRAGPDRVGPGRPGPDRVGPDRTGPGRFGSREEAVTWLDLELPNLVAAVAAAHDSGRWDQAYGLAGDLAGYFEFRHRADDWIATGRSALRAAGRIGPLEECAAAMRLGSAYRVARRFDDSARMLTQALGHARAARDLVAEGRILHNLGLTYVRQHRYARAESCHRRDLDICVRTGDLRGQAQALTALGDALRVKKRYREAVRALGRAIGVFQRLGDTAGLMNARINHALTCLNWRPATTPGYVIWQLCSALAMARELDARHAQALIFLNLSAAYRNRCVACHGGSALEWAQRAVTLFREERDPHGEAAARQSAGVAHAEGGDLAGARLALGAAESLFTELGAVEQAKYVRVLLSKLHREPAGGAADVRAACAAHDQDTAGLGDWLEDLPHGVLRGDTGLLQRYVFVVT
ncbi:tetratricopeptide repeat protein [Actinomadura scrupuli]|uniref:tetratricopeptide repeat protein n=1 Tax=Actinomadura scrupuli TaxID=559629 RepID=UPI003D9961B9